jgi:preprotein translocase SecE subunit
MEAYKAGQGSFTRLAAALACLIAVFLGCVELYSWIQKPGDRALVAGEAFQDLPLLGVPLSWKFLICLAVFIGAIWLLRRWLARPTMVDTLIETEMELKKVSWPTKDESMTATWVVIVVTILMTGSLALFDFVLRSVFGLVF